MKMRLGIACRSEVVRTATRIALIVGPVLVLINHGDSMMDDTMTGRDWLKSGLTMVVPYLVSTLSSISAYRNAAARE